MRDINKEFNDLQKEFSKGDSYSYEYFKTTVKDDERNHKYGTSRAGFDEFKKENQNIDYPGSVSYRVHNDGFVLETRIHNSNELALRSKELYDSYYQDVLKALDVKDKDSFSFYVDNIQILEMSSFQHYKGLSSALDEILKRYSEDDDFKNFLDKIKG